MKYILLMLALGNISAHAALDLELTQGINSAIPIAVIPFLGQSLSEKDNDISEVVVKDLSNSGRFKVVANNDDARQPHDFENVDFKYWKKAGINGLVVGKVQPLSGDKKLVTFQLLDPNGHARVVLSKQYRVNQDDLRALAHHISDLIYKNLTGEKGFFSTRIAYVLVKHNPNGKTRYKLEVADFDGHNPQPLLSSSQPIMSPAWSPNGKRIAYVSFENKRAQIYIVNIETGQRRLITSFSGINGAPAWSPGGKQLAVVLSKGGSPKLYLVDLASKTLTQLTRGIAIDTEPSFSPDGKNIIFTSDRGGSPQIYQLNLANKQVSRVTFDGNYNARASYSPDGDYIVMLHRDNKGFNIGLQSKGNSSIEALTFSGHDESPSFAPNGRLILYASRYQGRGVLNMVSVDGSVRLRLPAARGEVQEPAWSPYLG